MERITASELRVSAGYFAPGDHYWPIALDLLRAAETIDEMDKDIAIYETELEQLQQQLWQEHEGREEQL